MLCSWGMNAEAPSQMLLRAMENHKAGKWLEAELLYQDVLRRQPHHPDALHLCGLLAGHQGAAEKARKLLSQAVQAAPRVAIYHQDLALAWRALGQLDQAGRSFQRALELDSTLADAHFYLGAIRQGQGRSEEAMACFKAALRLDPNCPAFHYNLALAYQESKQLDEAIAGYRSVLALKPDHLQALNNIAAACRDKNDLETAADFGRRALAQQPLSADLNNNLGTILQAQGRLKEAVACFHQALQSKSDCVDAQLNLASALRELGELPEAEAHCRQVILRQPSRAEAHHALGNVLQSQARMDDAITSYEKALELKPEYPEAHVGKAIALLLQGDYVAGWEECEWRWQCREFSPHRRCFPQPVWEGEDLAGRTLLLHEEQGLGDTLQLIRYAPLAAQRGGRVILECPAPLQSLLRTVPGIDHVVARGEPLPEFDLHVPLLSLPRVFRTTLATIPASFPYLFPPHPKPDRLQLPDDRTLKVGVVWAGNPKHRADQHRSISLDRFEPLLGLPGMTFLSLVVGPRSSERHRLTHPERLRDLNPLPHDFLDTAAVVDQLDLLVSVDTSVAHLAGAMGKPVWLLLPFVPDFRWLLQREDSPWYPTMRLFRQPAFGDWNSVFQRLGPELAAWRDQQAARQQRGPTPGVPTASAPAATSRIPVNASSNAVAHFTLGNECRAQDRTAEAVGHFRHALDLQPEFVEARFNLALALQETNQLDEAIDHYRALLRLQPDFTAATNNLGFALKDQGRFAEALDCHRRVLERQRDSWEARNGLGNAWRALGRFDEAIDGYEKALQLKPDNGQIRLNLANTLRESGRVAEAITQLETVLAADPDFAQAHWDLSFALLLRGDYEAGWREYEWRWQRSEVTARQRHFPQPLWNGESLSDRTILIHTEQGYGETLQFIRYVPLLAQRGARVVVECPLVLRDLLESVPKLDRVVARGDSLPAFDVHSPLLSLPRLFHTMVATIPNPVPYLTPPAGKRILPETSNPAALKVGVVWAGNAQHKNDRNRSLPLIKLAPLFDLPGIAFFSLQTGPQTDELNRFEHGSKPIDLSPQLRDFSDTAAAISDLDLVISVDTSVAHLAGALGKTVWTLLPFAPDWRWLTERQDSPWYPTMRLFRQPAFGDWHAVVADAVRALAEFRLRKTAGRIISGHAPDNSQSIPVACRADTPSPITSMLPKILRLREAGRYLEAETACREWLRQAPADAEAWHLLGWLAHETGHSAAGIQWLDKAIGLDPSIPEYHNNRGIVLRALGRLPEALRSYQQALALRPSYPDAHYNLGNALQDQGNSIQAIDSYRQALRFGTDRADIHYNLGVACQSIDRHTEAVAHYRQVLASQPFHPETLCNLGATLRQMGQLEPALECCQQALRLRPAYPEALVNLGNIHRAKDRTDDAIGCFRQAIGLRPDYADAYVNLGAVLQDQDRLTEAIDAYRRAIQLQPADPVAHWNLSISLLQQGAWEEGWKEYEWRWQYKPFRSVRRDFSQPAWDGTGLDGRTLLVHAEQGLGDTIQFARFLPWLAKSNGRVVFECQPALVSLVQTARGRIEIIPHGAPLPPFDVQIPLLSLPRILHAAPGAIAGEVPYLFPPARQTATAPPLSEARLKVGLAWAGNPNQENDRNRSMKLADLRPLFFHPGVAVLRLQVGPPAAELTAHEPRIPVRDLAGHLRDFSDTAAIIGQLDLVISVDTSVAHLAGALGKTVWTLLCYQPDWRWRRHGTDCPWYPTMRLFRQPAKGNWEGVIADVRQALVQWLGGEEPS